MIKRLKEPMSADFSNYKLDSWDMPLGWLSSDGFFEEKWGIFKIPQAWRAFQNSDYYPF